MLSLPPRKQDKQKVCPFQQVSVRGRKGEERREGWGGSWRCRANPHPLPIHQKAWGDVDIYYRKEEEKEENKDKENKEKEDMTRLRGCSDNLSHFVSG